MNASKTDDQLHDYVIVALLESQDTGQRFSLWPLHITLLPWFSAPSLEAVEYACMNAVKNIQPFSVKVGDRAYFGQHRLPVKLIEPISDIQQLHDQLLESIRSNGWELPGRYVGSQFRPHVTQKAGRDAEGSITIDSVYIVEKLDQGYRQVVSRVAL